MTSSSGEEARVEARGRRFTVLVAGNDDPFWCEPGESLLRAAIGSGRSPIKRGCLSGGCGVCRVRILSGLYGTGKMSRAQVSEEEERIGITLSCRSYPLGPLEIEVLGKREVLDTSAWHPSSAKGG